MEEHPQRTWTDYNYQTKRTWPDILFKVVEEHPHRTWTDYSSRKKKKKKKLIFFALPLWLCLSWLNHIGIATCPIIVIRKLPFLAGVLDRYKFFRFESVSITSRNKNLPDLKLFSYSYQRDYGKGQFQRKKNNGTLVTFV